MKDDTPDYSIYTLDDLHDVARRVNKQLYPERYALILQELEKRQPGHAVEPFALPELSLSDGCMFPLLRFVGGFMAVSFAIYYAKLSWLEDWNLILGIAGGSYFAFFYDEIHRAPGEPITFHYLCNQAFRMVLAVCGAAFLARVVAFITAVFLMPSDSPDLISGMPNYETTEHLMNAFTVLGAIGALWFWWWRKGKVRRNS